MDVAGPALRRLRLLRGLKQSHFAELMGVAEATLRDLGWHEGALAALEVDTGATADPVIPILRGRVLWERIALADGSAGRIVTTIA